MGEGEDEGLEEEQGEWTMKHNTTTSIVKFLLLCMIVGGVVAHLITNQLNGEHRGKVFMLTGLLMVIGHARYMDLGIGEYMSIVLVYIRAAWMVVGVGVRAGVEVMRRDWEVCVWKKSHNLK